MKTKRLTWTIVTTLLACCLGAGLLAHPATIKGTVVSATATKASVSVPDEKTMKGGLMVFDVDKDTKILRGDKVVTLADAKIQKGEAISVRLNPDDGNTFADVIWLNARK